MRPAISLPQFGVGKPVRLPGATCHDFTSRITGRTYRVFISVPAGEPPPAGFPAFYLFDANSAFGVAAEIVRNRAAGGETRPAVVVGVGYPTAAAAVAGRLRFLDLSIAATQDWIDSSPAPIPGLTAEMTGGLDDFLRVVEEEIKPAVARLAPVDATDQSLFGHSLGGLAVLRALFARPDSYRNFVAASPSIWWADRAVLEGEEAFSTAIRAGNISPRILIEVGGLEQAPDPGSLRFFATEADARDSAAFSAMVDNAVALGGRLARLQGASGLEVRTVVFPDEGHGSVIPASLARGVEFALGLTHPVGSALPHKT